MVLVLFCSVLWRCFNSWAMVSQSTSRGRPSILCFGFDVVLIQLLVNLGQGDGRLIPKPTHVFLPLKALGGTGSWYDLLIMLQLLGNDSNAAVL